DFLLRADGCRLMPARGDIEQPPRLAGRHQPTKDEVLQDQLRKGQPCETRRIGGEILHILSPEKPPAGLLSFTSALNYCRFGIQEPMMTLQPMRGARGQKRRSADHGSPDPGQARK